MPLFYFNAVAGDEVTFDEDGEELPDINAARVEAVASARETLANSIRDSQEVPEFIQVTDGIGREVLRIALVDILPKSMRK